MKLWFLVILEDNLPVEIENSTKITAKNLMLAIIWFQIVYSYTKYLIKNFSWLDDKTVCFFNHKNWIKIKMWDIENINEWIKFEKTTTAR